MNNQNEVFQSGINYKKTFYRLYGYKRTYIVLTIILLIIAFAINRFSDTKYKNSTIVFISSQNNDFFSSQNGSLPGFSLFTNQNIIENEIEIIRSFSLVKKALVNLDLFANYYYFKKTAVSQYLESTPLVRKHEMYDESPIRVVIDQSFPQATYLKFYITFINDDEFILETIGTDIQLYNYIDDNITSWNNDILYKGKYKFGDEVRTRYFNFRILKTNSFDLKFTRDNRLYFYLNNMNYLTLQYQGLLSVTPTSEASTLLRISLTGKHEGKVTDYLNTLTSLYIESNLDKKNQMAVSTVDFIDSQISEIADSLSTAESKLKTFRSSYKVMDLGYQGQQIFQQLNDLEEERANLNLQRRYYGYLKEYLGKNSDMSDLSAPSSMNVVDPILTNLITQLITLNSERANNSNPQSIYLADLNSKIMNLKKAILENVTNTYNTLTISMNELNYRISNLSGQISQMPKTELQLRGIERKFKLNDAIYTYLLQKRSEAQIARAASTPDYEIIDAAKRVTAYPVSPKTKLNYVIALFLGLLLPTSVILTRDMLNNRISDPEEIENLTRIPILGKVFHNYRHTNMVVSQYPNSSVTESFRALRTNFEFFSGGGEKQVLLITSTTSGEGKTFCSINLASVFALNGLRTVLLEFDLRRPKIHQEFGSSNMIGISSYLIDKAIIDDIIMPTQVENLDLISAGPAAPNPAELIASEKTSEFIQKLKEMYDIIVIDSAPAGILTETHLLMKNTDVNIYVTRMEYTIRDAFLNTLKTIELNKFGNVVMLINDVNVKRDAYRYGYDKKYYTDDKKRGLIARLFSSKKRAS